MDTLKKQQLHFDMVKKGKEVVEAFTEEAQLRMAHGTDNECNAVATLVGQIIPFYFPDLSYYEEGSHFLISENENFMLVSPDGSLRSNKQENDTIPSPVLATEFKCPYPSPFKTPVAYDIQDRYIFQILAEMASMNVSKLIFISWSPESSTVFLVNMDYELWKYMLTEAEEIYKDEGQRPTNLRPFVKNVKPKLQEFRKNNVQYLCEIPSQYMTNSKLSNTSQFSPYIWSVDSDTSSVLHRPSMDKFHAALSAQKWYK